MAMHRVVKSSMGCLQRLAGRLILIFVVPAASLWMILAVWFSNLPGRFLPGVMAVALGVVLLFILARVKGCWQVCGLVFSLFTVIFIWHYFTPPSNDRNWQPSVARLSTARFTEAGDIGTVHNIRNFEYRSARDFDIRYDDRTFDLKQLRGVDLIISYWGHDAMAPIGTGISARVFPSQP